MQTKDIQSINVLNQVYLRKWIYFGSTYLVNDVYYLKEFIDLCINDFGEENVRQMLLTDEGRNKEKLRKIGKNWESYKHYLRRLDKQINLTKGFYDKLGKKDFSKNDEDMKAFMKCANKLPLIKSDLYALAIFLLEKSPVKNLTIKSDDWKILEHIDLKKLQTGYRKPEILPTTTNLLKEEEVN